VLWWPGKSGRIMRAIVCVFIFIAVVGAGLSREIGKTFTRPAEQGAVAMASAPRKAQPAPQQDSTSYRTVKLEASSGGHFHIDARVDGRNIEFVVDTGASKIVLRESSAAKLGIFPRPSEYTGRTSTANGEARYAPVRLNRVDVNGITVNDVEAAVMPDSALGVNLLGMTFLSRVKWSHDHGRLVLEQ
jgi:aspartyl protease family protein